MKKRIGKASVLSSLIVLYLAVSVLSQSPPKPAAEAVGMINAGSRAVIVNGAPAQRGSTIFNGNEVQTGDESASINLTAGGGVLSLAPKSLVKISRDQGRIIAEVIRGAVTVRSPMATTVIAPDRVVNSEPDNLYQVAISEAGTTVESFSKSVAVRMADGMIRTIAAQPSKGIQAVPQQVADEPEPVTPVSGLFVSANCMLTFNVLMVSGVVACRGVPVPGARVALVVIVGGVAPDFSRNATTDRAGRFKFTIENDILKKGGTAQVRARATRRGCTTATNNCLF